MRAAHPPFGGRVEPRVTKRCEIPENSGNMFVIARLAGQ